MTQQPYAPQYPQAPAQQYPPAPPVQQPYQPQPYAQPGYPQQAYPAPPQQPPAPPLATGTLDDYYNQPTSGSGPSISWSANGQPKPLGTSYAGIVARDVTNGDVQQQTDASTNAPKFYKDGRPQFVMKVPLKVQPSAEFPEGEATWFVRGQSRDELTRAMAEAGCSGAPTAGAVIQVTLVQRRPSRMGNPANIVQVVYTPPQGGQQAPAAPSPAAGAQPVPEQPQAPQVQQSQSYPVVSTATGQPVVHQQQIHGAPEWAQPVQQPNPVPLAQPVQQQYQQPVAPQQQLPPPPGLDPEAAALLARITGNAPQGAPQQ